MAMVAACLVAGERRLGDVGGCKRDEHEKHAQEGAFLVFGGLFRRQEGLVVVVASNGDGGGVSRCRGKAAGW